MQLTRGMFGTEFSPKSPYFGCRCGQIRMEQIVHNGGWYNRQGEKLGWGDLNAHDFQRITSELEEDELFLILHEDASFWKFVKQVGPTGGLCSTSEDLNAPGVEYVAAHTTFILAPKQVFVVSDRTFLSGEWTINGVIGTFIGREKADSIIRAAGEVDPTDG